MTGDFYLSYRRYLERYIYEGAAENILLEAYQDITHSFDENHMQAAGILDVHTRALREIMGIQRDSDNVQWIYIGRATEFLAQILIVVDAFLLQLKDKDRTRSLDWAAQPPGSLQAFTPPAARGSKARQSAGGGHGGSGQF